MIAPSIINGAQTIHALRESRRRDPKAQVLVRVIEIPWKEEEEAKAQAHSLISKIIFRTNQQNRMYKYDLRSNDPRQVSLAQKFLEKRIFYERKRGDGIKVRLLQYPKLMMEEKKTLSTHIQTCCG